MSKRIKQISVVFAVVTLAAAGLVGSQVLGALQPQKASVTSSAARNAAVVATTTEVLKQTSEIRELAILRPVKSGAESRAAIERMLIKNLNERTTEAEMHATELSLRKFGLAPGEFQYRPFIIKLLVEQVAGYYDPKSREFHLADWLELETQKPVMAHELTHALQDQHFNLRRFEKWPDGDSDAELAAHALIEGDATLAMNLYLAKNPLDALAFGRSLLTGVSTEQYDQAPRSIRESLIFPYLQGSVWATQVYKRGGWPMVSNAFTRLPLSTEQILHPEKYFQYERPVKVVLPEVASLLNASISKQESAVSNQQITGTAGVPPAARRNATQPRAKSTLPTAHRPLPTGWRRVESDVNGEWSYYLILDQFLNSPAESKRAAAGWAGDRYVVYEGPGGQVFLAQVTMWDTDSDAREFFDAYVKRTELRYPDAKQLNSGDSKLESVGDRAQAWETSEGRVVMQLRGSRVVVLEGIPNGVDSEAVARALAH